MARSFTAAPAAGGRARPVGPRGPGDWPVAPRTVAVLATLLAGALTLFHLGHKSLWLDEGYSLGHARAPWAEFWTVLTEREANGALHALVLFPWIRISDAEWWVRLPSAVAATAAVPLLYLLLRRLFDDRVGALGAVLLALNGFQLQFAQEARTYALTMALATASTLCFVAFVQDGRRGQWWAWVATSALLPYAHLFGWLVLGVQAAAALLRGGGLRRPARRLVAGFAAIAVVAGAVLVLIAVGAREGQAEGIPTVSPVRFVGVYARVAGNGGVALLLAFLALGGYVAVTVGRELWPPRPYRPTERQWGTLLLFAWLLLPPLAIGLVSPVIPLFGARYFVILAPPAAGLLAVGVSSLPPRWPRRIAAVVVVGLLVATTLGWYLRPPADDARAAARAISSQVEPGDAIVFLPWFGVFPFDAYAQRDPRIEQSLDAVWPPTGWGEFLPDHRDHPSPTEVERAVADRDRVWLVLRDGRDAESDRDVDAFVEALSRGHVEAERLDLDGLEVRRYDRPTP